MGVEHDAPTQSGSGVLGFRKTANNEAVARKQGEGRAIDMKASKTGSTGLKILLTDSGQTRSPLGGARKQLNRRNPLAPGRDGQPLEVDVGDVRREEVLRKGHDVAAMKFSQLNILQVYGTTRSRKDALGFLSVALQAADAGIDARGMDFYVLPAL